jgi:thioredoxin-like negative regulator of GroEL
MEFVVDINEIFIKNKNIIVYFYDDNLNYHHKFINMISVLEKENLNIRFVGVNIKCEKKLNIRFNFKSIPCLIFYSNDIEVYKHEGMLSSKKLKKIISNYYHF